MATGEETRHCAYIHFSITMDMLSRLGIWDDALDDAPYSVGDTTSSDEVDELTSNLRRRLGLEPTPSPFHSFQGVDENRPPLPRPGHSNSDGLHHNMHRLRVSTLARVCPSLHAAVSMVKHPLGLILTRHDNLLRVAAGSAIPGGHGAPQGGVHCLQGLTLCGWMDA